MQLYIIGIGQCGTSVAFDVISHLTGFVKSKEVTSSPKKGGSQAASNELLKLLNQDVSRREWVFRIQSWASRLLNEQSRGRKAFVPPQIAIIDGNPDNFVKDAFQNFRGTVQLDPERESSDMRQLADLILGTTVLGLGTWNSGCANGIVGERVAREHLPPADLQAQLGVNDQGKLTDSNAPPFPVAIFLVVSSGGGATGSGGGVYLAQGDVLFNKPAQPSQPRHMLTLNAIVLPSTTASLDNRRYALNCGRALARHANAIEESGDDRNRPSSILLFSNPHDEGDSKMLQQLNNYIAELAVRMGNFTFPGNVARIARDLDVREQVRFLSAKTSVVAMSHLDSMAWNEQGLESKLVELAFVDMYAQDVRVKAHGLSIENLRSDADGDAAITGVLSTVSSALYVIGIPPNFDRALSLESFAAHLRSCSGSQLRSGIRAFAYGSTQDLELTVFLRYKTMNACPLAAHFVGQYIDEQWNPDASGTLETSYLRGRMELDDDDAEAFEEIVDDLDELADVLDFDMFTMRPPRNQFRPSGPASCCGGRSKE